MDGKVNKEITVDADVLVNSFLKLLQRDGMISNSTYLEACKKVEEGKGHNVNSK